MDAQHNPLKGPSKPKIKHFRPQKRPKEGVSFVRRVAIPILQRIRIPRPSLPKGLKLKPGRGILPWKKVFWSFLVLAGILLGFAALLWLYTGLLGPRGQRVALRQDHREARGPAVEMALAMNRDAPLLINKETLFEKASVKGGDLILRYRFVRRKKGEMDEVAFLKSAKSFFLARACVEPKALEVLKSGHSIVYAFFDRSGRALGEIPLVLSDCSSLQNP